MDRGHTETQRGTDTKATEGSMANVTYKGFWSPEPNTFELEPYCLRVASKRWYMIARNPWMIEWNKKNKEQKEIYRVYALDRIKDIEVTDKKFTMDEDFDISTYFYDYYGVSRENMGKIERIVVKAWQPQCFYLESLPLHSSQKVIARDEESVTFEYELKPTFDFYQALISQMDQIKCLSLRA